MRAFLLLLVLLNLSLALPAHATAQLLGGDQQSSEESDSVSLSGENIDELISTLENEEERDKFIDNLKTLKQASDKEGINEDKEVIEDGLGLEAQSSFIISRYEAFIDDYNLDASLFGKSLLSGIVTFIALVLAYINRKVFVALRNYLNKIRDKYELPHDRFRIYARFLRYAGYFVILSLFIFTLIKVWNLGGYVFITAETTRAILSFGFNILIIILVGLILWEVINSLLEYGFKQIGHEHSNRVQTLMPIVRNVIFLAFATLFIMVVLSEIGINVGPLLAGAGIFGIAIGFGAQTMVKDFLTGFTIILEDLIQVGDVVKISDRIGLIEKITIRKVQLRDLQGVVYTVPFSEISIVENWTKDFSFYLMDVGVAYRENTDEVIEILKEVDEDLRSDENFKNLILEPIQILGVDSFADSAVIIKARIKTLPIKQWDVGREYNRRMKFKFDEAGIEIPFPHQTIYFGENKEGGAPPAHIRLKEDKEAAEKLEKKHNKKPRKTDSKPANAKQKGDNEADSGDGK